MLLIVCVSESNLFSIFESCGVFFFFLQTAREENHTEYAVVCIR